MKEVVDFSLLVANKQVMLILTTTVSTCRIRAVTISTVIYWY